MAEAIVDLRMLAEPVSGSDDRREQRDNGRPLTGLSFGGRGGLEIADAVGLTTFEGFVQWPVGGGLAAEDSAEQGPDRLSPIVADPFAPSA